MLFVAALEVSPKGRPLYLRLSHLSGFTKQEIKSWSSKHLVQGSLVATDGLNCFPGVEAANCYHEPIITGGDEYDEFKVFT